MNLVLGEYLVGTFTINVIRAQKLAPRGSSGFADPVVRVYKDGKYVTMTKTVKHTLDPVWNEEVVLTMNGPFEQITLEVSNTSKSEQSSFMGKVDLLTHEFVDEDPKPEWHLLRRQNTNQHVSGELLVQVSMKYHPKWESALKGGYELCKQRNYPRAIQELTTAIQQFASNPVFLFELYEFRCRAYMSARNYTAAKEDVASMSALDKNHPSCFYFLGRVALAFEDYDQALLAYSKGLEINPGNGKLSHALYTMRKNAEEQSTRKNFEGAYIALKQEQPDIALDIITDMLLPSDPQNHMYYWYRSIVHLANGRFDLAEKDIKTCCEYNSNFPRQNPTKQGKLSKRGRINPAHQERYFYLQDRYLFYFKSIKSKEFQGFIILQGASLDCQKKDLYIRASNASRIFQITAPSSADALEWATAIKAASKLPFVLPTEEQLVTVGHDNKSSSLPIASGPSSVQSSPAGSLSTSLTKAASLTTNSLKFLEPAPAQSSVVVSGISYEGWLHKAGEFNPSFKKRWFVLRSEILYYFKGKPEAKDDVYSGVQGSIPITKYIVQLVPSPAFAFELLPHVPGGRSYLCHASSEPERQRWINEIELELRRAQATLVCRETERLAEESTDQEENFGGPSSTSLTNRKSGDVPEVRLFTPKTDREGVIDLGTAPDAMGLQTAEAGRSRPQSRYYGSLTVDESSVNASIVDQRRKSTIFSESARRSLLDDDEGESDDEYTRLVKGDYGSVRSFGNYEDESSKGCCSSCTIQ